MENNINNLNKNNGDLLKNINLSNLNLNDLIGGLLKMFLLPQAPTHGVREFNGREIKPMFFDEFMLEILRNQPQKWQSTDEFRTGLNSILYRRPDLEFPDAFRKYVASLESQKNMSEASKFSAALEAAKNAQNPQKTATGGSQIEHKKFGFEF
ncbi:hypothetical protein [Campylobacter geochelonis]|uniref:Uncharacterized protein n=1 Tax=Campylobacter geochelonis TaxID=1780362 RepID=A0A128EI74_9BACT|nr:hypothetical protein [Campylobacter geochelonis]QKF71358.1 hypothetical protein CGEO_1046 [Campylobacter geochelonis]CZE48271.1 Uncharacterised protein [Campylobacter geochelonis]